MWQLDQAEGQIGATWTGEYLPIWVTEQRWAISYPVAEPRTGRHRPARRARCTLTGVGYTRYDSGRECAPQVYRTPLALHQFHYPGWQADWNLQRSAALQPSPRASWAWPPSTCRAGSGPLPLRLGIPRPRLWGTCSP